jgi:flagellar basal-body rod protein FlgF
MNAGIYSAVSGSIAALARLDAVANNVANSSTPGFKAERFVQRAARAGSPAPPPTTVTTPITRGRLETDFSQGAIESTGNPLDVALDGTGFMVVTSDRGDRLTRRGNFAIDAEGFLTTSDGMRVQGDGGDLQVGEGPVGIAPDGTVRRDGATVGKLRLVTVKEPAHLVREGGSLFARGNEALVDAAPDEVRVVQGALENANVSPVEAMVAIVDAMRGFEAYMHAAERLDQVTGRAISDVGRV